MQATTTQGDVDAVTLDGGRVPVAGVASVLDCEIDIEHGLKKELVSGFSFELTRKTSGIALYPTKQTIRCPITNKAIQDAVVYGNDGLTYEREALYARDGSVECYPNRALMEYMNPETDPQVEIQPNLNEKGVFLCPVTKDLVRDPVIDPEGNTFERVAILDWIRIHGASPITRNPLRVDQLYDNTTLLIVLMNEIEQQTEESEEIAAWKRDISLPCGNTPAILEQQEHAQLQFHHHPQLPLPLYYPGHGAVILQTGFIAGILCAFTLFILNLIAGAVALVCVAVFLIRCFPHICPNYTGSVQQG
jgi:U-box domain